MRRHPHLNTTEQDLISDSDRQIYERRQFMYSKAALLAGADVDRIMVRHPAVNKALDAMDRAFQLAHALEMPQGMRIIGPTGSGKSSLLRLFAQTLPKTTLFDPSFGVLNIRLMANCTRHQIVRSLLQRIDYPFPNVSTKAVDLKTRILIEAVQARGVRVLAIDEAHHLSSARRVRNMDGGSGNEATDWLREFNDETQLALILSGTDELDHLESIDPHLTSRLSARIELKDFALDSDWYGLLKAYAKQCTVFDLSNMLVDDLPIRIHHATSGNLRNLKRLLTETVLMAIDENINGATLTHAFLQRAHDRVRGDDDKIVNPFL